MKFIPWKPTYFVYRDSDAGKQLLADLTESSIMLEPYKRLTEQLRNMIKDSQTYYMEHIHEPIQKAQ